MNSTARAPAETLSFLATGRRSDLFSQDMEMCEVDIRQAVSKARILVVGGAGSIGAATLSLLARYGPRTLHVVDHNENKLTELVRDLRSAPEPLSIQDFRTFPLDYGSPLMLRLLSDMGGYDLVFNFAALKHVRSEKDVYSLLQMLDTNVVKGARFLSWLEKRNPGTRYFCVSTDKAANPVSLMGASKRIMEHVIFSGEIAGTISRVTSARFANVAFSDGSLLDSFLKRLQQRRVLAVPKDTRRYFLSLSEAGQICLIASIVGPHRHLLISRLDPAQDLIELESVAGSFLSNAGYEPQVYDDPDQAKANLEDDVKKGRYPLLLTERDTSGEKAFEEFVGNGETVIDCGLPNLSAIPYLPAPLGSLAPFLEKIERLVTSPHTKTGTEEISALMSQVVPELHHFASDKSLDERI